MSPTHRLTESPGPLWQVLDLNKGDRLRSMPTEPRTCHPIPACRSSTTPFSSLSLPFADDTFDAITTVVSVDYITRPLELFAEIHRTLKPGGKAVMSFSNRMFWHKAVRIWTEATEWQRLLICSLYFELTAFESTEALEVTEANGHDPLYIVQARKPLL